MLLINTFKHSRLLLLVGASLCVLTTSGCASNRSLNLSGETLSLEQPAGYQIVVPELTKRVQYNFGSNPFNYETYGGSRTNTEAKEDVPREIAEYLSKAGQSVFLVPADSKLSGSETIITYDELWGWDMGDILKELRITALNGHQVEVANISFSEMTIFNSHPTAKSLVPDMLDILFGVNTDDE